MVIGRDNMWMSANAGAVRVHLEDFQPRDDPEISSRSAFRLFSDHHVHFPISFMSKTPV